MDMWITANIPVTHKSTASVAGTGLVIIRVIHFVLFAADDDDKKHGDNDKKHGDADNDKKNGEQEKKSLATFMQRGIDLMAHTARKRYFRGLPVNTWIIRQLLGLRALAYKLKARINMKQLSEEESHGVM